MSKPDLATYGGLSFEPGIPGQIESGTEFDVDGQKTNEDANPIDFGVACARGAADGTVKPVDDNADVIEGITLRLVPSLPATTDGNNTVNYKTGQAVGILLRGFVWVKAAEAVRKGDEVIAIVASGGALGGSKGGVAGTGRLSVKNARWETTTALNAIGKIFVWGPSADPRTTT